MNQDEPGDVWAGKHSYRLVIQAEESSTVVMLIVWSCNPDHNGVEIDGCSAAWVRSACRPVWP